MAVKDSGGGPGSSNTVWDVVITAALMTDYNFRGVTQSNHGRRPRPASSRATTSTRTCQGYGGVSGESIDFPNRAAAEVDLYGGIRPTFDKLALDFGFWYYSYPGGQCYNSAIAGCSG